MVKICYSKGGVEYCCEVLRIVPQAPAAHRKGCTVFYIDSDTKVVRAFFVLDAVDELDALLRFKRLCEDGP
jgi:hypothetical protein